MFLLTTIFNMIKLRTLHYSKIKLYLNLVDKKFGFLKENFFFCVYLHRDHLLSAVFRRNCDLSIDRSFGDFDLFDVDEYEKHPNEVMKNEELTYSKGVWLSAGPPSFLVVIACIAVIRWR